MILDFVVLSLPFLVARLKRKRSPQPLSVRVTKMNHQDKKIEFVLATFVQVAREERAGKQVGCLERQGTMLWYRAPFN